MAKYIEDLIGEKIINKGGGENDQRNNSSS